MKGLNFISKENYLKNTPEHVLSLGSLNFEIKETKNFFSDYMHSYIPNLFLSYSKANSQLFLIGKGYLFTFIT